jgi:hypothetical protein
MASSQEPTRFAFPPLRSTDDRIEKPMAVADQDIPNFDEAESEGSADPDTTARSTAKGARPVSMFDEIVANRRVQQFGDLLLLYAIFTQLIRIAIALDQSWNESGSAVEGVTFSNQGPRPSVTPQLLAGLTAPAYVLMIVFVVHTNRWTNIRKSAAVLSTLGVAVGAVAQLSIDDHGMFANKLSAIGLFTLACLLAALLATSTNEAEPSIDNAQDAEPQVNEKVSAEVFQQDESGELVE